MKRLTVSAMLPFLALLFGALALLTRNHSKSAPVPEVVPQAAPGQLLKGQGALGDWRTDAPGVRRLITPADMPKPYASAAADNGADLVARPANAWPQVPAGFKIVQLATGLDNPRRMITAPNGDIFIAESAPGRIKVLRGVDGSGKAPAVQVYATGLVKPFGLAFYPLGPDPQFLYVGDTDAVLRFAYTRGDLKAQGNPQSLATLPGGGRLRGGGHWSRDIAFSRDGKKMYVSVGSRSNVTDDAAEDHRADILEFNPDGTGERIYAGGIRNAVGIATDPDSSAR